MVISGCTLELPAPEFDALVQLTAQGGDRVVLQLAGESAIVSNAAQRLVVYTARQNISSVANTAPQYRVAKCAHSQVGLGCLVGLGC